MVIQSLHQVTNEDEADLVSAGAVREFKLTPDVGHDIFSLEEKPSDKACVLELYFTEWDGRSTLFKAPIGCEVQRSGYREVH